MAIVFQQAGAGSGKTTSIKKDIGQRLANGHLRPDQLVAVTFTRKAAGELRERIGAGLLDLGRPELATALEQARIGTVHSVCGQLLEDFAFELGLSPKQRVIDARDKTLLLKEALDAALTPQKTLCLNQIAARLNVEDWQDAVLALVEHARTNAFESQDLSDFSTASIQELLALLPKPDPTINESGLRDALEASVLAARKQVKPTKQLEKTIDRIDRMLGQPFLAWEDWVRASKLDAGTKELALLAEAIKYGSSVLACPEFRQDLAAFSGGLFEAAQAVMSEFADLKAQRGLVDFVDQERLTLDALKDPAVSKRLKAQIRYLVVDEFQDTNPIQLALFARLAALADDVVFVGDVKQAIYGFRGSDPRLALAVMKQIQSGGGTLASLPDSWRSRPGLVHLVNDLYVKPFAHLLTANQINLIPRRTDPLSLEELAWWKLDGSNQNKRAAALAKGLAAIIASTPKIWDKSKDVARAVSWRDLAVLCFSNDEVAQIAAACAAIGIPVSLTREGLIETPEVSLALACLRRLADPSDSLASAEIVAFEQGTTAEAWLAKRLDAVKSNQQHTWNDNASPILIRLAKARAHLSVLSPAEALSLAVQAGGVHEIVIRWKESVRLTEHRLANLQRLKDLAQEYEDHCLAQRVAGTVAGFILWLRALEQDFDDDQAANPGNAITLSTYHKAKGLEWPIVVCASLNKDLKVSLYGVRILGSAGPFDWSAPLAGRVLRYWPNPFPDQKGNDPLTDLMRETPDWKAAQRQAEEEAVQLLYVGMTRARDQLVLTEERGQPVGKRLALLGSPHFPITGQSLKLSCGVQIQTDCRVLKADDQVAVPGMSRARHWLPSAPVSASATLPYLCPPSSAVPLPNPSCSVVHDFNSRITLSGKPEMDQLGCALHHCLALSLSAAHPKKAVIEDVLSQYPIVMLNADEILQRSQALKAWISAKYPGARLHCELPFSRQLANGQLQQGQIDLALELPDHWVIIDHKSNPEPKKKWLAIAAKHSGQLFAYGDAVAALTELPVTEALIHFSVSGGLVRVA
jgi:ATP-dependent helicase/nuclease subunit A